MHKTGNVIVNDNAYIIDQCLFDSGAESDNFISQNFIDMNCDILAEFISPHKSSIRLGDSKTTVNISQIATLTVTFCDTNFVTHDAILNFLIMPITHIDMIIGINSILYFLYDFFLDLLRSAKNNIKNIIHLLHPHTYLTCVMKYVYQMTFLIIHTIMIVYLHLILISI